jgi:hypothetical protein
MLGKEQVVAVHALASDAKGAEHVCLTATDELVAGWRSGKYSQTCVRASMFTYLLAGEPSASRSSTA